MGVKISALPAIVTPALTDVFPVVQAGVTYKETFTQVSSLIVATSGLISWIAAASTPIAVAEQTGYYQTHGATVTFNMPAAMSAGKVVAVVGNAFGWVIQANAGQTMHLGSAATSVAGSFASTAAYDSINLLCTVANTTFVTIGAPQGIITVA